MSDNQEILDMEICECGEKNVAQAIEIFENTSLPFKKAKKLVTECNKSCCRAALLKVYDMKDFGKYDYDEIAYTIQQRLDRLKKLSEGA